MGLPDKSRFCCVYVQLHDVPIRSLVSHLMQDLRDEDSTFPYSPSYTNLAQCSIPGLVSEYHSAHSICGESQAAVKQGVVGVEQVGTSVCLSIQSLANMHIHSLRNENAETKILHDQRAIGRCNTRHNWNSSVSGTLLC